MFGSLGTRFIGGGSIQLRGIFMRRAYDDAVKDMKNMKNFTKRRVFAEMKYIYEDHEKHTTWK